MGIVREHINFERGLDPKQAMDIGNLPKPLDILYCKKPIVVKTASSRFTIQIGYWVVIKKIKILNKQYKLELATYSKKPKINPADLPWIGGEYLTITPEEFFEHFEIEHGKTNESQNFTRGLDPKQAMDIGMRAKWRLLKPYDYIIATKDIPKMDVDNFMNKRPREKGDVFEIIMINFYPTDVIRIDFQFQGKQIPPEGNIGAVGHFYGTFDEYFKRFEILNK